MLGLLPIALLLGAWELLARGRVINPALFPPPSAVWDQLVGLLLRDLPQRSLLLSHLGATLKRLLFSLLAGTISGIAVGGLMGISRPAYRLLNPLLTLLMPIPGIAMAPLFLIWFGFGDPSIIALGAIATFFPVAVNTIVGVRSVDRQLIRAAKTMGANRLAIFTKVHFPWAFGYVLMGLKLAIARGWRTIIAVEFIAAAGWGLGYMIWDAAEYLRAGVVYAGIAVLIIVYLLIERSLVRWLEKLTIEKWGLLSG